jgi:NitT/TauT family transport system substrate-binding protein
MIARRHFLAGVGPALLLAAKSRTLDAQEAPTIRFVLDWKYEGEHAQFTVPITDGTYGRLGINVKLDRGNGSGDTVAKVAAGAYDMGLADTNTMVRFNANNPGNQLIAVAMVQDASASGVVGLRSKGIEKPPVSASTRRPRMQAASSFRSLRRSTTSISTRSSGTRSPASCATPCWLATRPMPSLPTSSPPS